MLQLLQLARLTELEVIPGPGDCLFILSLRILDVQKSTDRMLLRL